MYILECHCKKVKIQINTKDVLEDYTRCDCSFCIKRGAVMGVILIENLKILSGENNLSLYKFDRSNCLWEIVFKFNDIERLTHVSIRR